MQLLERTATILLLIGLAVPYLLAMNAALAIVGLFVGSGTRQRTSEALS